MVTSNACNDEYKRRDCIMVNAEPRLTRHLITSGHDGRSPTWMHHIFKMVMDHTMTMAVTRIAVCTMNVSPISVPQSLALN